MSEVRVESWEQLNECLYEGSWYQPHGRFRSPYAFRGLPDWRFDRRTSLNRLGGRSAAVEDDLLRNFRKYGSQMEASQRDSCWNWLAMGQHHGLPTRLLDWTFSPFVASHFVTSAPGAFAIDGVIWCIDFIKVRKFLPASLKAMLKKEDAVFFTAEMLDRYAPTLGEFDARVREESPDGQHCVIFFDPPSLDDRIVNQAALFSMLSSPEQQLEEWLQDKSRENLGIFRKIIVPAVLKWEVRDKLDMANITERVVFPGLDGLGSWLRRYYSPNHLLEVLYGVDDRYLARIQRFDGLKMHVTLYRGREAVRDTVLTSREQSVWVDLVMGSVVYVSPRPSSIDFIPD
jgi:hypothetical protein